MNKFAPASSAVCSPNHLDMITRTRISGHARRLLTLLLPAALLLSGLVFMPAKVSAQHRDHLTDEETDLVRFYQELDKRIEVLIKAADRRLAVINGTAQPSSKKLIKDEPEWGPLPKGTHAELLSDIAGILDEAITNIDDVNRRDEKNPLLSRSLRRLTTAAKGYQTQLATLEAQSKDPDEVAAIEKAADSINQILEVGTKLPAPAPDESKKKKKKP